ncbi:hypothetical protein GCM10010371_69750 [Streptomyces subrutilus]|uniref:DUF4232 domain-containing protein n=1 Tax=Streptomyces subrutilus TaxID=36818 RepID=A0A5P2UQK3_9ACTN|nr:DUF4232 domain-containing protein [Streptomyces subrutilus]QEU81428.1 DUF4232 domain-containing protein [Streptomyces subrutilus]GHA00734.1 hypothetical protein GCM10010371_69750 [Streptomyces subrutilus]
MRSTRRAALAATATALLLAGPAAALLLAGPAAATAVAAAAPAAPAAACKAAQLTAGAAQRTGAQVRFTVVNKGAPCELRGFPTVALAGQGSPDRNKPLAVTHQGAARAVHLATGGKAVTVLAFTPVRGEADGYCASGADPTVAPSLVVGVAGARLQVAPSDGGEFALCGGAVRATAFR